jgi:pyruvate ferredoxin oxidoreductase beta subunit/2-oxoisovalerate ferredoxin oxidoreductase beta subunit
MDGNQPIPEAELLTPGHLGCQGCGAALAMRYVLKALGEKTIVVLPACCFSIIAGPFPYSSLKIPLLHTAFETAAVTASGVRAGLDCMGDSETTVLAWAGDGGTFDIGLQALSGAAERNDNILYICYDNEAYMNTGIQRSSATPWGAWTTTTPQAKRKFKKDMMLIMAAHRIPYAATASVAYPEDLIAKVTIAKKIEGTRFIHLLAPCPPGWRISSEQTIKLARLAVQTRVFPLFEIENGTRYKLHDVSEPASVEDYLKAQGRFKNLSEEDVRHIKQSLQDRWNYLTSLASISNGEKERGAKPKNH